MRILITGITGFAGSHLADYILSLGGHQIWGTARHRSKLDNIQHLINDIRLFDCDIADAHSVSKNIKNIQPDIIFHLGAQSFVPQSWSAPQETMRVNVEGTINVLEAVREYCPDCIVQIAGSSEEYGMVDPGETPIKETNQLRPLSPYGVSKVAQDLLGYQYNQSYGLKIIRTRAFNHEGARRGDVFVSSAFAKRVIAVERGQADTIEVGNLDAIRDFTDVRDTVRAYWICATKGMPGEVYNIASGVGITMQELLTLMIYQSGLHESIERVQNPNLMRPSDVPILVGDNAKIKALGWMPEINLDTMVFDILQYWRNK